MSKPPGLDDDFLDRELSHMTLSLPRWLREATLLRMLLLLFCGLLAAGFLPWQESVAVPITIDAEASPVSLPARVNGALSTIEVSDGDLVSEGDLIATLGTREDIDQLALLEDYALRTMAAESLDSLPPAPPSIALGGPVQDSFEALSTAVSDLRTSEDLDPWEVRIAAKRQAMASIDRRLAALKASASLRGSLLAETKARLERYEEVAERGFVSVDQMSTLRQDVLRGEIELNSLTAQREDLTQQLTEARADLSELLTQNAATTRDSFAEVRRSAETALGAVRARQEEYLVHAPVAGRVLFTRFYQIGDAVRIGEELAVLTPASGNSSATGTVSADARAAIELNARVRVETATYPSSKFGFLQGRVDEVSSVASDGAYLIKIDLPGELRTSRGELLSLRSRSPGTAHITIRSGSIYSALLGGLRSRLLSS